MHEHDNEVDRMLIDWKYKLEVIIIYLRFPRVWKALMGNNKLIQISSNCSIIVGHLYAKLQKS